MSEHIYFFLFTKGVILKNKIATLNVFPHPSGLCEAHSHMHMCHTHTIWSREDVVGGRGCPHPAHSISPSRGPALRGGRRISAGVEVGRHLPKGLSLWAKVAFFSQPEMGPVGSGVRSLGCWERVADGVQRHSFMAAHKNSSWSQAPERRGQEHLYPL